MVLARQIALGVAPCVVCVSVTHDELNDWPSGTRFRLPLPALSPRHPAETRTTPKRSAFRIGKSLGENYCLHRLKFDLEDLEGLTPRSPSTCSVSSGVFELDVERKDC